METNEYRDPKLYKYMLYCQKQTINGEEFYSLCYKDNWYSLLYIDHSANNTITDILSALETLDSNTYFFYRSNYSSSLGAEIGFLYINNPDKYNWYLHNSTEAAGEEGIKIEFDDIINGAWKLELETNDLKEDLARAKEKIDELLSLLINIKSEIANITQWDTDKLFIDICRISADGKYLEIDMHCNECYTYKHFTIYDYKHTDSSGVFECIDWLLKDKESGVFTSRLLLRINTDRLNGPSMYYLTIEVELKLGLLELVEDYEEIAESNTIITIAVSDVTNAYFYLLPGLVLLTKPCDPCDVEIPTEIQRAFLVLWAHIEAMRLERWKEAELFYDLIKNNFLHCLGNFEVKQKSCNCHGLKLPNFNYRR